MNHSKNNSIQALRGIAALFVVVDHTFSQFSSYNPQNGFLGIFLNNISMLGPIGVLIFFIISGYIMSMTTENKPGGLNSAKLFMKKRIFRIYPTYWVWLSILIILWLANLALRTHDFSINKIWASYLLLPYIDNNASNMGPILPQGWTLIYEMFFYIIFSILIIAKIKNRMKILTIAIIFLITFIFGKNDIFPSKPWNDFSSNFVLLFFPFGMLAFELRSNLKKYLSHKSRKLTIYSISILLFCYLMFYTNTQSSEPARTILSVLIFTSFMIADIKNKILLMIGNASYSIYLSHIFISMFYGVISKANYFSQTVLLAMSVPVIIISILFGLISYLTIEKKLQVKINNSFAASRSFNTARHS
ncbi:acyltransferase [Raoultella ornithinolytica]|uniref:acyltransferase family protein n=1 Tax=Raoultella ornithinolytica TaxID=54291 RepID=UPI002739CB1B|nr:acyltransferase [Raoultella ornithinolytica]WLP20666.1 acyltransferase [Raoultella ornithinolytica]